MLMELQIVRQFYPLVKNNELQLSGIRHQTAQRSRRLAASRAAAGQSRLEATGKELGLKCTDETALDSGLTVRIFCPNTFWEQIKMVNFKLQLRRRRRPHVLVELRGRQGRIQTNWGSPPRGEDGSEGTRDFSTP